MKRAIASLVVCALAMVGMTRDAAAGDAVGYDVKARIASTTGITVGIQRVVGTVQTPGQQAIDFGQLILDTAGGVFRADNFYIVDVGVTSNAPSWTVTHGVTPVNLLGSTITPVPTLSDKINVTFVRVAPDFTETPLTGGFLSYANSNNYVANSAALTGGNLRIYYGIAGGTGDAPGVVTVPASQPGGNYLGRVTLTLAP